MEEQEQSASEEMRELIDALAQQFQVLLESLISGRTGLDVQESLKPSFGKLTPRARALYARMRAEEQEREQMRTLLEYWVDEATGDSHYAVEQEYHDKVEAARALLAQMTTGKDG